MDTRVDMSVGFGGLKLGGCVFTASGTCGYADELGGFMDTNRLGGFITKSITLEPRKGNPTPRIVETDSGMLNAIGLANIGVERFIEEKVPLLAKMKAAVFVNVAGREIDDYVAVIDLLAGVEGIAGFELNVSCPNVKRGGITFGTDVGLLREITAAAKAAAAGKMLMVKLTPSVTSISEMATAAVDPGADALSLINTFTAMVVDIETRRPVLANRTGGLSGPAIKPIAVYMVNRVYNEVAKERGIPILGMGGIRNASDAVEFLLAGATAVAVGTASFVRPASAVRIMDGIERYCERMGVGAVAELTGALL